jgi:ATP-dependent Clp protease ATP-binding subunit ClpB
MEIDSMPVELDSVMRKIMQLEIEKSALSKESDALSKERLKKIDDELKEQRTTEQKYKSQWEKEKAELQEVKQLKQDLENLKNQLQNAFNESDYSKAAELQYSKIPKLEKQIEEKTTNTQERMISEVVSEDNIAEIISKWTHIPVEKLVQADRDKLLHLKEQMSIRVIGQDHALKLISDAIIRQRAGIKDANKPIGSFMFLGPTGVGKTEVARSLAENLFDDESHIVRIDMSEYMERHSVSRLVGAPPGYVG